VTLRSAAHDAAVQVSWYKPLPSCRVLLFLGGPTVGRRPSAGRVGRPSTEATEVAVTSSNSPKYREASDRTGADGCRPVGALQADRQRRRKSSFVVHKHLLRDRGDLEPSNSRDALRNSWFQNSLSFRRTDHDRRAIPFAHFTLSAVQISGDIVALLSEEH